VGRHDVDDRALLEFETRFYRHRGAKAAAIRDELGLSETAYWQRIVAIINHPPREVADDYGPTIARLNRQLTARRLPRRPCPASL
jgi:hypothetical protein